VANTLPPAARRPVDKPATSGRYFAIALPVLTLAATITIAWIGIRGQRNEAERARLAEPPPPVVERALPELRRCFEHGSRGDASFAPTLMFSLRVGADGRVLSAKLRTDPSLARELEGCLLESARAWQFPPPEGGAPVSLEVPVTLDHR
jgi:hypothetical protein